MKQNGDTMEGQFTAAYEAYADAIFRHCYFRISDREKALDIMQDTFSKVWMYIVNGNIVDNIRALLYKTANNLIIDEYRKKKTTSLDALQERGFDYGHNEQNRAEDVLDAEAFVQRLGQEHKDIIVMRYIDDMSPSEIADVLGVTENVISVRLHRARQHIREKYGKEF